jgi:hypothetical protein
MTFAQANTALKLEVATGGKCREMLADTDDFQSILPIEVYPGVVRLLFEDYSMHGRLVYLGLPIAADRVRQMIKYYEAVFGTAEHTSRKTSVWVAHGMTLELAVEPEASRHPNRGYLAIYREGLDLGCASHN